ncbi:stage II sporulation protein R [Zhaonella formicivorans]|uniref:stage II sporulation protein R n=1 Tax=Zhaonella formicivorans TaxID=2528593 RepID=UPI001D12D0FF|nr:stage II sporulation protein R [Zhaonella formicivorans]
MQRRGLVILGILFFMGVIGVISLGKTAQPAYNNSNLLRFHVIANSDSLEDQSLKRKVRDRLVEQFGPDFAKVTSLDEARAIIRNKQEEIKKAAYNEVRAWGKDYAVEVTLGNFAFPTKTYGDFTLPAGNYEALRVVLGEGKGQNWWCVLFPPLCFVDISNSLAAKDPAQAVLQGKEEASKQKNAVEIRFKILEVLRRQDQQPEKTRPLRNVI